MKGKKVSLLDIGRTQRVQFDPQNPEHRREAVGLIKDNKMGNIRFFLEPPFTSVRDMLMYQTVLFYGQRDTELMDLQEEPTA